MVATEPTKPAPANWPLNIGTKPLRIVGPLTTDMPWDQLQDDMFTSASVDKVLEYLTGEERVAFMNQLWRVLQLGAQATVTVPYYSHPQALANPLLKWPPFSEHSFMFFDRLFRKTRELEALPITCDFAVTYYYEMTNDWLARNDAMRVFGLRHYWGVCTEIVVTLTKRSVGYPTVEAAEPA